MKSIALNALIALFIVAASIAAYHRFHPAPAPRVGVVDVSEVYRAKEAEFLQIVAKAGATDSDRENAMQLARVFARALPQALEELPLECNCIVLVRTALAATSADMVDLTPGLKQKLGLSLSPPPQAERP
jgi:hypothetical protein